MLYKMFLTFQCVSEILRHDQMKATEQYFPMVLFIMLYKVFLTLSLWMEPQNVTIQMKAKANKTLGPIQRDLWNCPKNVKEIAYTSLLTKLQNYNSYASVTDITKDLGWATPETSDTYV